MARLPSPGTDSDEAAAGGSTQDDDAVVAGNGRRRGRHAAPAHGPRHAAPSRLRRLRPAHPWRWGMLVVLLALVALVVVQVTRPLPAPALVPSLASDPQVSGAPVPVPWPSAGQGAYTVPSLGLVAQSGPEQPVPVASVTKMMTAYLVLQAHPLGPGDSGPSVTLTAADEAESDADQAAGNTEVPVKAGETLTERQLLDGLLVPSADNLADVLAAWVAGSPAAFVGKMNATAAALGMGSTHYADASGLDRGSVSTAADSLRLAAADMQNPTFAAIVDQPSVTLPIAGTLRNFVTAVGTDGVVGVKSGFTDAAGGCLVLAADRVVGGRTLRVLVAVTGQTGAGPLQAADGAALAVLDSVSRALVAERLAAPGSVVGRVRAPWGASAPLLPSDGIVVLGRRGDALTVALVPRRGQGTSARLVVVDGGETVVVGVHRAAPLAGPSLWWRLVHG
ncbi:MAG TPA: hypothetical protein VEI83_17070 [Acidimicrobiales bacterium]|nr:hypothetical protein [Acidimicrobiales bacterium]